MTEQDASQRAVAMFVAGIRDDIDLVEELLLDAADGGAQELADTLLALALVAGTVIRDGSSDPAGLEQLCDQLPARFALEGDTP